MARYIDGEALRAYLEDYACIVCRKYGIDRGGTKCGWCAFRMCIDGIDKHGTVDAEKIIRCENCKHRDGDYCHRFNDGYSAFIHRDDFCNYGERRKDETD